MAFLRRCDNPCFAMAAHCRYAFKLCSGFGVHGQRMNMRFAKFSIGQVVKHRVFSFRGVIYDVDPVFANTDEWWEAIPPEVRPAKDQPFYHLLAENDQSTYVAYVSEQNLLADDSGEPVGHPHAALIFENFEPGHYNLRPRITH